MFRHFFIAGLIDLLLVSSATHASSPAIHPSAEPWPAQAGLVSSADLTDARTSGDDDRANCQALLQDRRYRCRVAHESGQSSEFCLASRSPGALSRKFDLETTGGTAHSGCTCAAAGRVSDPDYNATPVFQCVGRDGYGTLQGAVYDDGSALAGNSLFHDGSTAIMECVYDPACEPPAESLEHFAGLSCSDPRVHPATPAGDVRLIRDENDRIIDSQPVGCLTTGVAEIRDEVLHEIVTSPELAGASRTEGTCGRCLARIGREPPPFNARARIFHPTYIETLGTKGYPVVHPDGWHREWYAPPGGSGALTSYCQYPPDADSPSVDSPQYGQLSNRNGYELVAVADGYAYGTYAYTMWDPASGYIRVANVDRAGVLTAVFRRDYCAVPPDPIHPDQPRQRSRQESSR